MLLQNKIAPTIPPHPLGSKARVLLCSVFGPYAQNDEYGSRVINPMELYHNQVTRLHGAFSLRMFHRSWGIMLIQCNISAPCTLLDFPTRDRFIEEIATNTYDIVGITSIMPNVNKVKAMCELIRRHLPGAKIVVGGHVANLPNIEERIDAEHIVRGDGVRWFRRYLSEDETLPIEHPRSFSAYGAHTMGIRLRARPKDVAAMLLASAGCPLGCNFCSTSAMFGGKGRFVNFYETGDELYNTMLGLERDLRVRSFFVMDENFLLHRRRALRLLELMERDGKSWSLYVFSSANVLRTYSIDQLVRLGISWVWMGIEGKNAAYEKLRNTDTLVLVRELQAHGIRVLGSSIIGLEHHTPQNMREHVDYTIAHATDFHQFMLYTPLPGTALFEEHRLKGTLLDPDCEQVADTHGQLKFFHKHPHFPQGTETEALHEAFRRDFEINGPSVLRIARTLLQGWKRYHIHPDSRIRTRYKAEAQELATTYVGALWASRVFFRDNAIVSDAIGAVLRDIYKTFGMRARLAAPLLGRFIRHRIRREEAKLARGTTYEPPTFYEKMRVPAVSSRLSAVTK